MIYFIFNTLFALVSLLMEGGEKKGGRRREGERHSQKMYYYTH